MPNPKPTEKREFHLVDAYVYSRVDPLRWVLSHVLRHKQYLFVFLATALLASLSGPMIPVLTGWAFDEVLKPDPIPGRLLQISLLVLGVFLFRLLVSLIEKFSSTNLGERLEYEVRNELYASLLGKSQTFHNRQRVGDIMARATRDVERLNPMVVSGFTTIFISLLRLIIPIVYIGLIHRALLVSPLLFVVLFVLTLLHYIRNLAPVASQMQQQLGLLNASLTETITNIEVVKTSAQENQERQKFEVLAQKIQDLYAKHGRVQAFYLPLLMLGLVLGLAFLHGLQLVVSNQIVLGDLIAYMGLMWMLEYPSRISVSSFSAIYFGIAGARRIFALLEEETELDENRHGYSAKVRGEVILKHVTFSYGNKPVLKDISFRVEAGQTVAIVGQTGAGKSTLVDLINRTYDVNDGQILIDEVDVRDWHLEALRSQISMIEQEIFLFSRSIAENIAFGLGENEYDRAMIQKAADEAQVHDFIMGFKDGYDTLVGERGVTLSGGQRQRIAIARALLTDPHILILDDATSAVDSATEDKIQQAIRHVQQGRTTFLITHRLSQIRQADKILLLSQGELIDQGIHAELFDRCAEYRKIFAPYMDSESNQLPLHGRQLTVP
jgi:ATP-binding cassette subfamily B protein